MAACVLCAPASAFQAPATQVQLGEFQGMRSGSALGMLRTGPAGTQVLIRSAGPAEGSPGPWTEGRFSVATGINPAFSQEALLAGVNRGLPAGSEATDLGFGAVSTGGDLFPPIAHNGSFSPMPGGWVAISFQVDERPSPAVEPYGTPGSALRSVHDSGRNAADAVLSYYAEGNEGVAAPLVHATVVEQTGDQMGVPSGASSRLAGLDLSMGVIAGDPLAQRSPLFAPVRGLFYFTFMRDWLEDSANAAFVAGWQQTHGAAPDARTIYRMDWNTPAAPLAWSGPAVEFSEDELFGSAGAPHTGVELDAISVLTLGSMNRVVFSTTAASGQADQVMGYDRGSMGSWSGGQPLRNESGQLVSEQMGLNTLGGFATTIDDVRGLCTWDPAESAELDGAVGTAIDHPGLGQFGGPLGLSVNRSRSSDQDTKKPKKAIEIPERIDLHVTGLDPMGFAKVLFFLDHGPFQSSVQKMLVGVSSNGPGKLTASLTLNSGPVPLTPGTAGQDIHVVALAISNTVPMMIESSWVCVLAP